MKDKWMNLGYDEEELKPYLEPSADINDPARIRKTVCMCHRFEGSMCHRFEGSMDHRIEGIGLRAACAIMAVKG